MKLKWKLLLLSSLIFMAIAVALAYFSTTQIFPQEVEMIVYPCLFLSVVALLLARAKRRTG